MPCPSCCGSCTQGKTVVWVFWSVLTFFSAIYSGLALASFSAVSRGKDWLQGVPNQSTYWNSLLASCMLGFLIVLFFMVFSFLVLISRSFGDVKLAYGIMLGTTIHTSWFLLLAGLVLQNRESDMKILTTTDYPAWSDTDYKTYQATYIFSYILVGLYILAFIILLFGRKHIGKVEEAGGPTASGGSQPVNVYVDMASMKSGSLPRNNQV